MIDTEKGNGSKDYVLLLKMLGQQNCRAAISEIAPLQVLSMYDQLLR